jgi:membrane protein DedA with SNARE-associated domain
MHNFIDATIAFVQHHGRLGVAVVFALAFCESFAFVSLAVPATAILVGIGGIIAAAGLDFWSMWAAAALGAVIGDWLAYSLAYYFKDQITHMWPFTRHPALLARGVTFFQRWGALAVFGGRFFGPLRAVVPLVAGIYGMPWLLFQLANVASAALWAAVIFAPGFLGARWLMD